MRRFAADYQEFFRQPGVPGLMAVALLTRMPVGMIGLALLLHLRESLGSFAVAGILSGIYFISLAIGGPIQGRIMDRSGPRKVVWVTSAVHPMALIAVLLLADARAPLAAIAMAGVVAGVFATPKMVLIRTLWRHRFADEENRRRAFSLDAVLVELNFTLGPAIVAAVVAAAGARAAFATAIGVSIASILLFLASPVLRHFPGGTQEERHLLGPLREGQLVAVFVATLGFTAAVGLVDVGYPAYAASVGATAFGGVLLALNAFGSAVGGAIFGGLRFRASVERQFVLVVGCMALPLAAHLLVDSLAAFCVAAFVTGLTIAPAIACQSVLVSRLAPAKYATEAFTWSSTSIVAGLGAGMALGGWLSESSGAKAPFLVAALLAASTSAAFLLRLRRT